jgi:hypothetical protein
VAIALAWGLFVAGLGILLVTSQYGVNDDNAVVHRDPGQWASTWSTALRPPMRTQAPAGGRRRRYAGRREFRAAGSPRLRAVDLRRPSLNSDLSENT